MRVLITDFLAESDFESEVLPGVEVDALLSLIGHRPPPTDTDRSCACCRKTNCYGLDHLVRDVF